MMIRQGACATFVISFLFVTTITFAGSPGFSSVGTVQGKVREINLKQGLIVLESGVVLRAQNIHQLDGLVPGAEVRVVYEEEFARFVIQRLEVVASRGGR